MQEIIAKCGYRCDLCSAYETNLKIEADKQLISDMSEKYFGMKIPVEAIQPCPGCLIVGADPNCPVRPCVIEKGLKNCAYCDDFACDKLIERMDFAQKKFEEHPDMPVEEYERFVRPFNSRETLGKIRKANQS